MKKFLSRFRSVLMGVLSGFDRVVFRGSLRSLMYPAGLHLFLNASKIRLIDFPDYAQRTTEKIKRAAKAEAERFKRPHQYLPSPDVRKEDLAREILAENPVQEGLICVFTALEPCMTFEYYRSPKPEERGYRLVNGKCLHIYKYYMHPTFGFMNARIQTWFPFNVQVCINGREWLAHELERRRSDFKRQDNCFTWLKDPELAQRLMDRQLKTNWPRVLDATARFLNPWHPFIFQASPMQYYWSAFQTEWATDIMFKDPHALAEIYPGLVRHAIEHFRSPDVMRFLGKKLHGNFLGEVETSFKDRPEGIRVKHWVQGNSIKMYDKAGNLLRVETTIGNPSPFKVFRPVDDDKPEGKLQWQTLRKGVADLHRRAQVSQKANNNYLEALSVVEDTTPCSEIFDTVSCPVIDGQRRTRALRLNDPSDLALLQIICRGEFATSGFRNKDIRQLLYPASARPLEEHRRLSAKTSRLLRLLRVHGLISKIPKSHAYRLTTRGQLLTTALFATRSANIKQLLAIAA